MKMNWRNIYEAWGVHHFKLGKMSCSDKMARFTWRYCILYAILHIWQICLWKKPFWGFIVHLGGEPSRPWLGAGVVTVGVFYSAARFISCFDLLQTGCTDAPPTWWDSATRLPSYLCWRYKHVRKHPSESSQIWNYNFLHLCCNQDNIPRVVYKN